MEDALTYQIQRVRWQYFATLTWRSVPPRAAQRKRIMSWLRWFERKGRSVNRCLWLVRFEAGELTGRDHVHILIGGNAPSTVNLGMCFTANKKWESLGGGIARVRMYSRLLRAAQYTLKGLQRADYSVTEANKYEVTKFSSADSLWYSSKLPAHLRAIVAGRRVRSERAKRPAGETS